MLTAEKIKTGEVLVKKGLLTKEQIDFCLKQQGCLRQSGIDSPIGQIVLHNKFTSREDIENAVGEARDIPVFEIPDDIRKKFKIYIHGIKDNTLLVSSVSPLSEDSKNLLLKEITSLGIKITSIADVLMGNEEILAELNKIKSLEHDKLTKNIEVLSRDPSNGQILQQVLKGLFIDAIESRASDIHISKSKEHLECSIMYRVDGVLVFKYLLPPQALSSLIVRIKIESGMDISESRTSQDGRISFTHKDRGIDFRVAVIPTFDGESITIRLLDPYSLKPTKEIFKDYPRVYQNLRGITDFKTKAGGLVLIAGTTGSGKTTTMYGIIKDIQRHKFKILTVEEPVEYTIAGVKQTPVNMQTGFTFANVLRAQVRQDPDVLVVGEMRDFETVETALRSVESGHLVLTTLHAIDVRQAVSRLAGMLSQDYKSSGLFVLANYLKAVISQKLVHKLCNCAKKVTVADIKQRHLNTHVCELNTADEIPKGCFNVDIQDFHEQCQSVIDALELSDEYTLSIPEGCEKCENTGYFGRALVAEAAFFPFDVRLRDEMEGQFFSQNDIDVNKVITLDRVEYFSTKSSIKTLLLNGVIDPIIAFDALDLRINL